MHSHESVMNQLGCSELRSLIAPEFLGEFGLDVPGQYGMVCLDVKAQIANLESCGAGPFLYATSKMPNWTERGEPKTACAELALGYSNGQQIELLGPGKNTRFYAERIPQDGSIAIHHACIFQNNTLECERRLNEAGFKTAAAGHIGVPGLYTTRIRYVDTRATLGFYLELTEYKLLGLHLPPGEKLISALAKLQARFSGS